MPASSHWSSTRSAHDVSNPPKTTFTKAELGMAFLEDASTQEWNTSGVFIWRNNWIQELG
ncbi:hypothetical protein PG994_000719 [Apiospora phragmitis]|uniref:Uncharacterized protein n=1 Tax=Apiospora phragmitis TaxID=2905665 RepID=A0ABR1X792_9PEZI